MDAASAPRSAQRQRSEEDAIDDGKNRGVGADAQGQRQGRHDGESRTAPQRAPSVSKVLQQLLEPVHAPHRTSLLGHERRIADAPPGVILGVAQRLTGGMVFFDQALAMKAQFLVHLGGQSAPLNHIDEMAPESHHV
jgi:hypothetical protein